MWLSIDTGTLVNQVELTTNIFPLISICPHPPIKNWNQKFAAHQLNKNLEFWEHQIKEQEVKTSDSLIKLYKEVEYDPQDIIYEVDVEYKELFATKKQSLLELGKEEPVHQELGM